MAENDKMTISIEANDGIQNQSSNTFISGPIEIFATVDYLDELLSEDLKNAIEAKLSEDENCSLIVFVKQTFGKSSGPEAIPKSGNLRYRGSYYRFQGFSNGELTNESWVEVGIGTHIHENKAILDKISNPTESLEEVREGTKRLSLIAEVNPDNSFDLNFSEVNELPDLPENVLSVIDENLASIPEEYHEKKNEYHHLDASLEALTDSKLSDLNHPSGIYGSCQDLFNTLYTIGERIFVYKNSLDPEDDDFIITRQLDSKNSKDYQELQIQDRLFEGELPQDSFNYLIAFDRIKADRELSDFLELFINGEIVNPSQYSWIESEEGIILSISKSIPVNIEVDITESKNIFLILVVKKPENVNVNSIITQNELFDYIQSHENYLSQIRSLLFTLYKKNQLYRKRVVPQVFLTNDQYGNFVWDGKLAPTTSTKFIGKKFSYEENIVEGTETSREVSIQFSDGIFRRCILVTFDKIKFFSDTLPLVMFNNTFIYDFQYEVIDQKLSIYIAIRKPEEEGTEVWYDPDEKTFTISLILITNGTKSISDDLARDYLTKKDFFESQISGMQVVLDDFSKKKDLRKKANRFHTHSAYATKDHTHDFRYADFFHSHPEYLSRLEYYASLDPEFDAENFEQILNSAISEYEENVTENVRKILVDAGFTEKFILEEGVDISSSGTFYIFENGNYIRKTLPEDYQEGEDYFRLYLYFSSRNISIDGTLEDAGQELLNYYNEKRQEADPAFESVSRVSLDEILSMILGDLGEYSVESKKVLFNDKLSVKNHVGGINPDIYKNATEDNILEIQDLPGAIGLNLDSSGNLFYPENTNLRKILQDILSPYQNSNQMLAKIRPRSLEFKLFDSLLGNEIDTVEFKNGETFDIFFSLSDIKNLQSESLMNQLSGSALEISKADYFINEIQNPISNVASARFPVTVSADETNEVKIRVIFNKITASDSEGKEIVGQGNSSRFIYLDDSEYFSKIGENYFKIEKFFKRIEEDYFEETERLDLLNEYYTKSGTEGNYLYELIGDIYIKFDDSDYRSTEDYFQVSYVKEIEPKKIVFLVGSSNEISEDLETRIFDNEIENNSIIINKFFDLNKKSFIILARPGYVVESIIDKTFGNSIKEDFQVSGNPGIILNGEEFLAYILEIKAGSNCRNPELMITLKKEEI